MKDDARKRKLAALFGMDVPKPPTKQQIIDKDSISREAEAALAYADDPKRMIQRECKQCGLVFAVNRSCIAYCSDVCRQHALSAMGIDWNPKSRTPEDRWSAQTGGREPLTVPPKVLELLKATIQQELTMNQEEPLPLQQEKPLDEDLHYEFDPDVAALLAGQ